MKTIINVASMQISRFFQKLNIDGYFKGRQLSQVWRKEYKVMEDEMLVLDKLLTDNCVIFDIGANIGEFSFFVSTIAKKGRIYSFEPQKEVYNICKTALRKLHNVHVYNYAISNYCGDKTIYIPIINDKLSFKEASLDPHFNDYSGPSRVKKSDRSMCESIKTITLDKFCIDNNICSLDFIKIDTEGHEKEVIQGALNILSEKRPFLLIEIFPYVYTGHFEEVTGLLRELKYVGYVLSKENFIICPLNENTTNYSKGHNYFFIPEEKEKDIIERFNLKI